MPVNFRAIYVSRPSSSFPPSLTHLSLSQALYLPSEADYSLLKPMRHLTLKETSLSLSRSNVLSMLEDLWTKALEDYLEIPRKEFKFYRVILIVPDIIERPVLKELMNLLLLRMEFAAAFLHQASHRYFKYHLPPTLPYITPQYPTLTYITL